MMEPPLAPEVAGPLSTLALSLRLDKRQAGLITTLPQLRLDAGNGCQAPADGRLAAAIATIRDNRFPIRDRVERNIKLIRRIGLFLPRQCKN
jgi:hypothetical protein